MKRYYKKIFILLNIFFVFFSFGIYKTQASYDQTVYSYSPVGANSDIRFGQLSADTFSNLLLKVSANNATNRYMTLSLSACTGSDYSTGCTTYYSHFNSSTYGNQGYWEFSQSSNIDFDFSGVGGFWYTSSPSSPVVPVWTSSKYVRLTVQLVGSAGNFFYGNSSFTSPFEDVNNTPNMPYIQLATTGNPIVPPDLSTHFTSFIVNQSVGTVLATGYWSASATSSQSQEIRFWQVSPVFGQENYVSHIATTTGNFSFTFPYSDSNFQISATTTSYTLGTGVVFHSEIYQLDGSFDPFSNTGTPPILLTSTSTSITATSTVNVGSPRSLSDLPEPSDCSLSAITGCIKNAVVWLFYPSNDSVESFKGISDTLSGKFPFSYVYDMNTMRLELFEAVETSTTTISLNFKIIPNHATSTLTLLSHDLLNSVPYSGTVKTILGWILWLLGIEYIYYRVLRAHDPHTPS